MVKSFYLKRINLFHLKKIKLTPKIGKSVLVSVEILPTQKCSVFLALSSKSKS